MPLTRHHSQSQHTSTRAWQTRVRFSLAWGIVMGIHVALLTLSGPGETPVYALEKYGRPLPALQAEKEETAENGREEEESLISGYILSSAFVSNPTFTARPDNTGLAGLRHMLHLETDLYKQYLTAYTDQNFFSDRTNGWIKLAEWDDTYGLTGLLNHWGWRIQYERDKPLDRSGLQQLYADALVTYRFKAEQDWTWWKGVFPNQNLTAYAGPGWLFFNQNYFARPDNTGRALLRYVAHFDLDLYREKVILFGDMNMFTDRTASSTIRPSELDWILGVALRWHDYEVSVYQESDQPLDQGGLVQKYWAVQLRVAYEVPKRIVQGLLRQSQ